MPAITGRLGAAACGRTSRRTSYSMQARRPQQLSTLATPQFGQALWTSQLRAGEARSSPETLDEWLDRLETTANDPAAAAANLPRNSAGGSQPARQSGQSPFAGTARRALRTNGGCAASSDSPDLSPHGPAILRDRPTGGPSPGWPTASTSTRTTPTASTIRSRRGCCGITTATWRPWATICWPTIAGSWSGPA